MRIRYNMAMRHRLWLFPLMFVLLSAHSQIACAQTATLKEIHAEGMKTFTEAQAVTLPGLAIGSKVVRQELQDAADILLRSGLLAKVSYKFDPRNDAVFLSF